MERHTYTTTAVPHTARCTSTTGTPTTQHCSHTQQNGTTVPAPPADLVFGSTVSSQYDDTPHLFILNQAGLTAQHNGMVAELEGTPTTQQSAIVVPRCNISIVLAV